MSTFDLKTLIEKTVYDELEALSEAKKEKRPWRIGDKVSEKLLNSTFGVFHLSKLDHGQVFTFTPRIPKYPWKPIEDDFTERVSLAPTTQKAFQAVNEIRPYLYAGDIKGYSGDEVETLNLSRRIKNCPSSPGNKYNTKFNINKWIKHQLETDSDFLTPKQKMYLRLIIHTGIESPSKLPEKYKDQFYGCVPDAKETSELWATEPVELMKIATYGGAGRKNKYRGYFSLTKLGAKVFNAITSGKGTIPYE